ncbi:Cytochrome P450 [Rhynchospora pubera]|uniref:Cytochrome P450 n=1 Tax=Rhynchospora pubera TaxID=906938 RepID=A0AAV8FCV7_9POAL|nr:Cytochrome P450 [Rhynchospora pubera]
MEFTNLTVSLVVLFLLPSVLFLIMRKTVNHKNKINLPPGPWKLPFIGCLHHLAFASLPHHALLKLARSYGPVMFLRAGEVNAVVLSSREAAREMMKTQDANFSSRPLLPLSNIVFYGCTDLFFSDGVYWRQLRRICNTDLLCKKRVNSFAPIRRDEILSMLREFHQDSLDRRPVNFCVKVAKLVNNIVCRSAFRKKCKSQERLFEITKQISQIGSGFGLSDPFPSLSWMDVKRRRKLETIQREMDMIIDEAVNEHLKMSKEQKMREDEMDYLLDALIKAKELGDLDVPLTLDNIKAVMLDVFFAGSDTSSTTLQWVMSELLRHPVVMEKVQAEVRHAMREKTRVDENTLLKLSYLKQVIKETLRLHPVVPLFPRVCKDTCELLGYTIPSGTCVIINAWALGRDPQYWTDAEEFKPERFEHGSVDFRGNNFEFLPFGAGRRMCPGILLGMATIEEALAYLLLHFDWRLPDEIGEKELDMSEGFGGISARKEPLHLIPILKVPLPSF